MICKTNVLLGIALASQFASGQSKKVEYELSFPNAVHHEAEITATFTGIDKAVLEVVMSRSSPGRYALHEFAKNVYNLRAFDVAGKTIPVTRTNPYGWNVAGGNGTAIIRYTLYGDHADGTYSGIDQTHAHLNLPATLIWAHGFENAPSTLTFDLPAGAKWKVATQLEELPGGKWGAPNLEWLMDSPVELSNHSLDSWQIGGATFRLALHHRGSKEQEKALLNACKTIVAEEGAVFGAFPKYDHGSYTFLVDYLPYVFGDGMEHRDSTSITGAENLAEGQHDAISTVSHEFFHSWNVKRIRPQSLEPFDFEKADMSAELWFAEGFTSYYGELVLKRAGIDSLDQFAAGMGRAVNAVLTKPGRMLQSAEDMSRMAPFVDAAKSVDSTNFNNTFISYYTYGDALALGIDLAIREEFPGKSLDDWMRAMWRDHPDIEKPYTLDSLTQALDEVVQNQIFAAKIFNDHIAGLQPLDYGRLLSPAGLKLQAAHPGKAWIGETELTATAEGVALANGTLRDTPLYEAGLDRGDQITDCAGNSIRNTDDFNSCVAAHKPGDQIDLKVLTREGKRRAKVILSEDPTVEIVSYERAGLKITDQILAFRESWLGSQTQPPK